MEAIRHQVAGTIYSHTAAQTINGRPQKWNLVTYAKRDAEKRGGQVTMSTDWGETWQTVN